MSSCLCFRHTRPYNRHKLAFRSEPCVYLGIAHQYKGYKCLTRSGKVLITRHVVFDENVFPFRDFSGGFLLVGFASATFSGSGASSSGSLPIILLVPMSLP